jgi:hypothetical protein
MRSSSGKMAFNIVKESKDKVIAGENTAIA